VKSDILKTNTNNRLEIREHVYTDEVGNTKFMVMHHNQNKGRSFDSLP
jgi:hypothetical protein